MGGSDTGGYKSDRGGERGGYFGRGHRLSAQSVFFFCAFFVPLYMCLHTTAYVSSHYSVCTAAYVSSHFCICVRTLLCQRSQCSFFFVFILLCVSSILLNICPHTTIYVSAYACQRIQRRGYRIATLILLI